MAFDMRAFYRPCAIGFRVEVHDQHHEHRNCTFDDSGNMDARDPTRSADALSCLDHLGWRKVRGPFISFFTDWTAALRRRQWIISRGASAVSIIVVWLKGLTGTYDAFDLATNLGFRSTDHFLPEILVHGGIFADSYRILTVIRGTQEVTDAALSVEGLMAMVTLPRELVTGQQASILLGIHHLPDFSDRLRDEIYTHTGVRDELKFLLLLLTMANIPHLCESNGLDTTITCQPHGIGWHFEGVVH
ncbi:hypothetical protein LLEC1_07523 [Akanthomyces lecanii]|uniref:Uncharacterized protein n=1 Tax=Cordyceps confragosa TaxID=2714763 RepID=A0A179I4Y4_CORDF|nr:hypothetical protein LLEC1_07523 [Akanthomyces lecanii]